MDGQEGMSIIKDGEQYKLTINDVDIGKYDSYIEAINSYIQYLKKKGV